MGTYIGKNELFLVPKLEIIRYLASFESYVPYPKKAPIAYCCCMDFIFIFFWNLIEMLLHMTSVKQIFRSMYILFYFSTIMDWRIHMWPEGTLRKAKKSSIESSSKWEPTKESMRKGSQWNSTFEMLHTVSEKTYST